MKASEYNFFYPLEDDNTKLVAFNARTCSLALIENDKYEQFKNYLNNGIEISDEKFLNDLRLGMFLIDDDENERDVMRYAMFRSRFDSKHLSLTLAPTSDCNFRCVYCYEKNAIKPIYMSEDIQDQIIDYIKRQAEFIGGLFITWYGGEPLLAIDIIKNMTNRILEICEEHKINYSASMISNGYLLNKEDLKDFADMKIYSMQITIDGTAETHDKRRPLADGSPTFKTIMENIKECFDVLPNVTLRVNVDKENISSFNDVVEYISNNSLQSKLVPYMGKVCNDNECYIRSKCFSAQEFSETEFEYFPKLLSLYKPEIILNRYPQSKTSFCGADIINSFVINADGNIFKCWSDIGNDASCIGNITSYTGVPSPVLIDYLLHDPTVTKPCSNCKILPICMGNCPFQRRSGNPDNCIFYKYTVDKYIKLITQIMLKQRKEAAISQNSECEECKNCSHSDNE